MNWKRWNLRGFWLALWATWVLPSAFAFALEIPLQKPIDDSMKGIRSIAGLKISKVQAIAALFRALEGMDAASVVYAKNKLNAEVRQSMVPLFRRSPFPYRFDRLTEMLVFLEGTVTPENFEASIGFLARQVRCQVSRVPPYVIASAMNVLREKEDYRTTHAELLGAMEQVLVDQISWQTAAMAKYTPAGKDRAEENLKFLNGVLTSVRGTEAPAPVHAISMEQRQAELLASNDADVVQGALEHLRTINIAHFETLRALFRVGANTEMPELLRRQALAYGTQVLATKAKQVRRSAIGEPLPIGLLSEFCQLALETSAFFVQAEDDTNAD